MKTILVIAALVGGIALFAWGGLSIQPKPFPEFRGTSPGAATRPLPGDLPRPVEKFYQQVYGVEIPEISSAVVSGRARLRVNGITFPARFRFTYLAGQGYRHYIEATFYGVPIMTVNETYLDGRGRLELPFGVFEGEQVEQAANLGLWAESIWMPAVLVSDPRVAWQPLDDQTAILRVPFGEETQRFIVRFDPETGLLSLLESMRYRDAAGGEKILWLNEAGEWARFSGGLIPSLGKLTWFDEGTPWANFQVEQIIYNVDVTASIRSTGLD